MGWRIVNRPKLSHCTIAPAVYGAQVNTIAGQGLMNANMIDRSLRLRIPPTRPPSPTPRVCRLPAPAPATSPDSWSACGLATFVLQQERRRTPSRTPRRRPKPCQSLQSQFPHAGPQRDLEPGQQGSTHLQPRGLPKLQEAQLRFYAVNIRETQHQQTSSPVSKTPAFGYARR